MSLSGEIAVLDYGMGNLRSVAKALERVGGRVRLASERAHLHGAVALVFPGQGALPDCMSCLRRTGLDDAVRGWVADGRPYLGVCLGLQALFESSEEGGGTPGLGLLAGTVVRFRRPASYKIPHMGWNTVQWRQRTPLDASAPAAGAAYYFVHSYHAAPADPSVVWADADYGGPFCAAVARDSLWATQFHPEKSQELGLRLYRAFVERVRPTG